MANLATVISSFSVAKNSSRHGIFGVQPPAGCCPAPVVSPLFSNEASAPREIGIPDGQELWFAHEVQPHESGLRNWLRRRFPWLTDVDDLVQESYVRIVRAKREGRVNGDARSYLFETAKNAAVDQARRNQIVAIEAVAKIDSLPVLEEEPNAADTLTREEELEILAQAIEALPERCRLIVKLQKFRGLSYQEIAQQLGISVNTVNAQVQKAMRLCRDYLEQHGVRKP
jgi:RNA polymerase sigma factor (sigma-70 family)